MSTCCDGTGFISFIGDYSTRNRTAANVPQVRRCPGYVSYFRSGTLIHDHPEKAPIFHSGCRAAVELHKQLITKGEQKTTKSRREV